MRRAAARPARHRRGWRAGASRSTYGGLDGATATADARASPRRDWRARARVRRAGAAPWLRARDLHAAVTVRCQVRPTTPSPACRDAPTALAALRERAPGDHLAVPAACARATTRFDDWVAALAARSRHAARRRTSRARIVYAGIPWFATVFGRDGLITAAETLAFAPELAAGILRRLAALQGRRDDPERDEAAGQDPARAAPRRDGGHRRDPLRPLLRQRRCDAAVPDLLAALRRPHRRSRAGPRRCGRRRCGRWPGSSDNRRSTAATSTYARRAAGGLVNQGWKDSHDAIIARRRHASPSRRSRCARSRPTSTRRCRGLARAGARGSATTAPRAELVGQAPRACAARFAQRLLAGGRAGLFALALDGERRPCARGRLQRRATACSPASRGPEHAARGRRPADARRQLLRLGRAHARRAARRRYNPMSYHNGSVWPHDNALIAAGLRPLRLRRRRRPDARRAVRRPATRHRGSSPAGAVLRLLAPRARPAGRRTRSPAGRRPGPRAASS